MGKFTAFAKGSTVCLGRWLAFEFLAAKIALGRSGLESTAKFQEVILVCFGPLLASWRKIGAGSRAFPRGG